MPVAGASAVVGSVWASHSKMIVHAASHKYCFLQAKNRQQDRIAPTENRKTESSIASVHGHEFIVKRRQLQQVPADQ
jgi:hypothetical protein